MSLLNPWALLGLLSLPAIVWLHTHLERNRRVVVSSIFLWAFLDEKFQGQRPKFIRISWLLLLDLLIAGLLCLALAKPVVHLPAVGGAAVQQIILLDTSASMWAEDAEPSRFSQAKDLTINLLEGARQQDQTVVVTFGGEAALVGNTLRDGVSGVLTAVDQISPGGMGNSLRQGLALALSAASPELPQRVYVITDGAFPEPELADSPTQPQFIFVGFDQMNQAIITPELTRGKSEVLFFQAVNYASAEVSRTVEVYVDDYLVQSRIVQMPPRESIPFEIEIPANAAQIEARIVEADQFPGDNQLYLGPGLLADIKVLIVADDPAPIDRALQVVVGEENVEIIHPEEYVTDRGADLVIFRGFITKKYPTTTALYLDPHLHDAGELGWFEVKDQPFLPENQSIINEADFLNGLDFGSVRWGKPVEIIKDDDFEAASLVRAGLTPLLLSYSKEDVTALILTTSLEDGNFTKHPLFPIFLYQIVDYARPAVPDAAYLVGDFFDLGNGPLIGRYSLKVPGSEGFARYPEGGLQLTSAGHYTLSYTDQNGVQRLVKFGVSQGDPGESDIQPRDWRQNFLQGEDEGEALPQTLEIDLSPWLLFAVVVLLLMEAWRAWR